ncbi:MAG: hypothetical protein GY861_28325 [bacterium]|nr:hypothetical protein [bacterium]
MMNRLQIVRAIQKVLKDASILKAEIITEIDSKVLEIARDVNILTLIEENDVIGASAGDLTIDMPDDFHHDLLRVYSITKSTQPEIKPNKKSLYSDFIDDETGTIQAVATDGTYMYILPEASEQEDLRIDYYKKPDSLTADTSEPTCIPKELRKKLLVHGVLIELLPDSYNDPNIIQLKMQLSVAQYNEGIRKLRLINKDAPRETPVYNRKITMY